MPSNFWTCNFIVHKIKGHLPWVALDFVVWVTLEQPDRESFSFYARLLLALERFLDGLLGVIQEVVIGLAETVRNHMSSHSLVSPEEPALMGSRCGWSDYHPHRDFNLLFLAEALV